MYFPLLSVGDVLKTALLNTVLGMGTVFSVLIFISLLISLFVYIPKLQAFFEKINPFNKKKNKPVKQEQPVRPAPVPVPKTPVPEQNTDDLELIAVITAAIAASTGMSTDGFVVRSIRRSPANNWNNQNKVI